MPDTNAAANPLPEPSGANQPNLSVVPETDASTQKRGLFNKKVDAEVTLTTELCAQAKKLEYAGKLADKSIDANFISALLVLAELAGRKGEAAVQADAARTGAVRGKSVAQVDLVNNLQTIQGAAKLEHLPGHPEKLIIYGVGQDLDASKPALERNAQALINKANEERPGGLDTAFIEDTRAKCTVYVQQDGDKGSQVSKGKQARTSREAMLRQIGGLRRKIQYAADVLWPHYQESSVQARNDFKLPLNGPFNH